MDKLTLVEELSNQRGIYSVLSALSGEHLEEMIVLAKELEAENAMHIDRRELVKEQVAQVMKENEDLKEQRAEWTAHMRDIVDNHIEPEVRGDGRIFWDIVKDQLIKDKDNRNG